MPDDLRLTCSRIIQALAPVLVEAAAVQARVEAIGAALADVAAAYPQLRRIRSNAAGNAVHEALEELPDRNPGSAYRLDVEAIRTAISNVEELAAEAQETADRERQERLADLELEAREIREQLGLSQGERHAAE